MTDRSISRRIGVWYGNADIRQSPGIVATNRYTLMGWDDTRNGDDITHTQDVYTALVQYQALGPGSSAALQYSLAVVAGLGVFGLVLLLLAWQMRARFDPRLPDRPRESQTA